MPGGVLTEYIRKRPHVDRRSLVGDPPVVADLMFTTTTSYVMSLKVSSFFTPET